MSAPRGFPCPGLEKKINELRASGEIANLKTWAIGKGLDYSNLTRAIKGKPVLENTARAYASAIGCDLDDISGSATHRAKAQAKPGSVIVKRSGGKALGRIIGAMPQIGPNYVLVRLNDGEEVVVLRSNTEPIGPEIEELRAAPGVLEETVQAALISRLEEKGCEVLQTSRRRKLVTCPACERRFRPTGGDGVSKAVPDVFAREPDSPPFTWVGLEVKSQAAPSEEQAALAAKQGIAIVGTHEDVEEAMARARSSYGSAPRRNLEGVHAKTAMIRALVEADNADFEDDTARLKATALVQKVLSACDQAELKFTLEVLR